MPVSTAQIMRRRFTSPSSSTSTSTTVAIQLANEGWTETPRPQRGGRGEPQPALSAASLSAACRRGALSSMAQAEGDRVLAGLVRQLVDEALDDEDVVRRPDAAPEAGRHPRRLLADELHVEVGDVVGHVDGAVPGVEVLAVDDRRRQQAGQHRRAGDDVLPAVDLAVLADGR